MRIPFSLHRRIPLVRRPFWQRDAARAERNAALAERDAALAERDAALAAHDKGQIHQQGEDLSMLIEWRKGVGDELNFWNTYFDTKGACHRRTPWVNGLILNYQYKRELRRCYQISHTSGSSMLELDH